MAEYEPKPFFTGVLINDPSLTFEVSDFLIDFGVALGTNFPMLREVYKTLRDLDPQFLHKPMIGKETIVSFDYDNQTATLERTEKETLTIPQFLQFLGKVDVTFAPIYPVGSVVELDESMLPDSVSGMFSNSELGARVTITGRKIPLISEFDQYIVDYYGRLWPFGEFPGNEPILISNMMIKRPIQEGFTDDWERKFSFDVLRATQVANQQISTAFMTTEDALQYYDAVSPTEE